MKCLILAAGYATRLYPLTENFPKPLLKVGDKTILDHLIDDMDRSGMIDEYIVISNHKFAVHFDEWASEHNLKITVVDDRTTDNDNRLGAVRDIEFAINACGIDDDCMVIAGDNVLDFSLVGFINYFKEKNASVVMRYFEGETKKLQKSGVLTIKDDGRVIKMSEKPQEPESNWCCPPFYIYKKEDIARIAEALENGCGADAPGSFVSWLCAKSEVYAFEMPGKRYDIGNLESYENVKKTYRGITNG